LPEATAVRVRVVGRVQAVGYRDFVRRTALTLNLSGWARNDADGAVTVHAEGDEWSVKRLIDRLREGPRLARVDDVSVERVEPTGASGFDIGY
jgi:acylphosphatase